MIGGGIFSVLGAVAKIPGSRTWLTFVAAGAVALTAAVSLVEPTNLERDRLAAYA